ncbi:PadR family transcriptional regulator [Kibdelosporangium aridum]|uniref:PadR family transcriptional regulator n=1 Tax=Kibdelosporangium aridum TaxID=2030 RepID=UPI0035F0CA2A
MNWALPEWTVLALLREQPRHGFAIAASTAVDGPVGRVWQIARPVIYRALDRLEAAELIRPLTVESGPGPQRTIYELTPRGRGRCGRVAHRAGPACPRHAVASAGQAGAAGSARH